MITKMLELAVGDKLVRQLIMNVVQEEREACAKIADDLAQRGDDPYYEEVPWTTVAINIAAAIRARK